MLLNNEMAHHGIKGQKWGIRRFQNKDGTLTEAGKKRLAKQYDREIGRNQDDAARLYVRRTAQQVATRYAAEKLSKAAELNNVEEYDKWAKRVQSSNEKVKYLDNRYNNTVSEGKRILQKIENDPNVMTYNSRRMTYSYWDDGPKEVRKTKEYKKHKKAYYHDDPYETPNAIRYDRTRVLSNTSKNKKKAFRKNEQKRGIQLIRYN